MEVFSYMHEGGVSIPHRTVVGPTSLVEDNGKTDTDQTVSIIKIILSKSGHSNSHLLTR